MLWSKYNTAFTFEIAIVKRAVVDFAVSADWTPAAGDVKISKDGGAAANVTNLPTAITMGNTAIWQFVLTATEMSAARVVITVADAATKAVEDQLIYIQTYGNASAQHALDLGTALASQTVGTATAVTTVNGLAANTITAASIAADAITDAKVAADVTIASVTGAVGSVTGAVGSVTGNVGGNVVGTVAGLAGFRSNTAQAGAATTITLDASASATNDFYKGLIVFIASATGAGQARLITSYVGATKVATVATAWATNPDATSVFVLWPQSDIASVIGAVGSVTGAVGSVTGAVGSVTGNVGGNVTGSVGSVAAGGITAASLAAATITAAKFGAGAIDAAAIATDAIDADSLKADAVTEIQTGLSTVTTAQVKTQVTDALAVDTYAEVVGSPAANAALSAKINWLFKLARNRMTQTATTTTLYADDATTADTTSTVADNGTTFSRTEWT